MDFLKNIPHQLQGVLQTVVNVTSQGANDAAIALGNIKRFQVKEARIISKQRELWRPIGHKMQIQIKMVYQVIKLTDIQIYRLTAGGNDEPVGGDLENICKDGDIAQQDLPLGGEVLQAVADPEDSTGAVPRRGDGVVAIHHPKLVFDYLDKIQDRDENTLKIHFICSVNSVLSWPRGEAGVEETLSSTEWET